MAFTVEDGTVVEGANSFCSVAFADSYFQLRDISAWDGSDSQKEVALIKASDYLTYIFEYKGCLVSEEQPLSFPRIINGETVYPIQVQYACCELALIAQSEELYAEPSNDESMNASQYKIVIGPIEESITNETNDVQTKKFPKAESYIKKYLKRSNVTVRA